MENAVATQTVRKKVVNSYVTNQLIGLSPGQLLLKVYDFAITSCQQEDGDKASRAVSELIGSLNFEHHDISVGLFRLYQYTIERIRMKQFHEASGILKELRDTWAIALENYH